VIDKEGAAPFHRIHGNRHIPGAPADACKGIGIIGVGFGSNQFTFGGTAPIIGSAGLEKAAGKYAKGTDELARIAALKSGPGKLQKKLLESLLRLRRAIWTRISGVAYQSTPVILAKRLKTIGLHSKRTLDSQIESRKYTAVCRLGKWH
jgi:hypothetical protein